jgi:hypothetical protein
MKWKYVPKTRRLQVSNVQLDLPMLKRIIERGLIPTNVSAITYRTQSVTLLMTGDHLQRWLSSDAWEDAAFSRLEPNALSRR